MPYRYFPIEFSSYENYVKYLKEKGFAIEVTEENNPYKVLTWKFDLIMIAFLLGVAVGFITAVLGFIFVTFVDKEDKGGQ